MKYFDNLDNPMGDYKIYYKEEKDPIWVDIKSNINFDYKLSNRLEVIDKLIKAVICDINIERKHQTYEYYDMVAGLQTLDREENIDFILIDNNYSELENRLCLYQKYILYLLFFYPQYKSFLEETNEIINKELDKIKPKEIKLPETNEIGKYSFPNSWYITPNNYLYNTGSGHKEGNLVYSIDNIRSLVKHGQKISILNYSNKIEDSIKQGYTTEEQFNNYSNLVFTNKTIITPELLKEIDKLKYFNLLSREERLKSNNYPKIHRIYQPRIMNLVIGYYAAKTALYTSFSKLNESSNAQERFEQILELSNYDLCDLLVRFCGFTKVESNLYHTLTTSSLNATKELSEYLDRGWNVQIVPGIVYNSEQDKVLMMDFDSCFIQKYIDNILDNYSGIGKILIKKQKEIIRK